MYSMHALLKKNLKEREIEFKILLFQFPNFQFPNSEKLEFLLREVVDTWFFKANYTVGPVCVPLFLIIPLKATRCQNKVKHHKIKVSNTRIKWNHKNKMKFDIHKKEVKLKKK